MSRPLDAKTLFKQQFGYTPTHHARVPGRIELLGNHTDYNAGLALSLAVDKYVSIATSPRSDGKAPSPERCALREPSRTPIRNAATA